MTVQHSLTTTTFELDGYRVVQTLGVVRGIMVRSRSIFGTIGGSLQTLFGGNITLFSELCERTRAESFELMVGHAEELHCRHSVRCHGDHAGRDRGAMLWNGRGRRGILRRPGENA
jgi:Putative heavy-metal-binding